MEELVTSGSNPGYDLGQSTQTQQRNKPVRVRLYGKALAIQRAWILEKQGTRCALCPLAWNEIDHINGDPSDNNPRNVRGLCKSCNIRERNLASGIPTDSVNLSVCVPDGAAHDNEDSMERNQRTEGAWVEFVTNQLEAAGGVSLRKDNLTGMSAFQIGLSVATVGRHWKKYACPLGPFEIYRPNEGTSLLVRRRK